MPSLIPPSTMPAVERERALHILARTLVHELDRSGFNLGDIARLASEIIGQGCEMSRSHRGAGYPVTVSGPRIASARVVTQNHQRDPEVQ